MAHYTDSIAPSFEGVPLIEFSDEIFHHEIAQGVQQKDGQRYDFMWRRRPGANRLFVFFSGAINRSKNRPPFFHRWSWAPKFPGHCLFFSDPELWNSTDVGLAWFAGNRNSNHLDNIINLILTAASRSGVPNNNIWMYGSSGGGFAALMAAAHCQGSSVTCINPQISIRKYYSLHVNNYFSSAFGTTDPEPYFEPRFDVLSHIEELRNRRVIYAQNTTDVFHYKNHFSVFSDIMRSKPKLDNAGSYEEVIFSLEGGHNAIESGSVFDDILSRMNRPI